ncbi:hypothetical protein O980_06990 [Mycobacterium avium subsp. paratuberculosis 08-8281]|nr:hypothetical protein [Mycobacterium avium]ETB12949.1 hypothetical protein O980_06990 [Mycobacterium avium subsp. paratuberculosis 08-8281]ETB36264.1 hypothetical protein O975_19880 [Mycobacterium avium subsp. paratuberculosis 11-1786]QPM72661.1 hypothetical protein MAPS_17860 [Mycobacterium avium subsp. paratuberculosis S397]
MTISFNHTIVASRDKRESAEFLAELFDLMARKVIPHFKRQLDASRASHDWAKGMRDQLLGRAGEAVVKAISEHVDEHKDAVH